MDPKAIFDVAQAIFELYYPEANLVFRCILDGEMLVWDTSANRFAEFGSNQEIGLQEFWSIFCIIIL